MEKPMSDNDFDLFDKTFQARLGQLTSGISPAALTTSCYSWMSQLALSPGRLLELAFYPAVHFRECSDQFSNTDRPKDDVDPRFKAESWRHFPWHFWAQSFCLSENWWLRATTDIPGLPKHVERTMSFMARQMLDALSPSNFVATNPELFQATTRTNGKNLVHGMQSMLTDAQQRISETTVPGLEQFVVGKHLAVTPGRVVFRNHLIELIQYAPQSKTVFKEPILMLPAWIMKYYILDLSPENSLVNWLVGQGHTVFMVSWRNPDAGDRDLGLDDYYRQGAMAAIDFICAHMPHVGIHLMGYCLGGTLATLTAAAMANDGDQRLQSLTLLASQADFTEAGELLLFITESEVAFLKNMMWDKGYLDGKQMAGTFQMLHSNELIWSRMVHDRMNDERRGVIDLLAWNADATRLPYKMHSEYLEKLFLHNDFVAGRFTVEGRPVSPEDIKLPIFAVSTEQDHVAPWRSVHKIHLITSCEDLTFILTSGGHNAGIVSEPGHKGRFYHIHTTMPGKPYLAPDRWLEGARLEEGSWWLAWHNWLTEKTTQKKKTAPPILNKGLCGAPGTYVLQK
jgi:polyhydroxyalkanoate synthase subunit PhaC